MVPINIEGMSFNVTKNLEDALRHLWDEQFPRMIWIDVHQSSRLTGKKLPSTNHGIYISERISSERMASLEGVEERQAMAFLGSFRDVIN